MIWSMHMHLLARILMSCRRKTWIITYIYMTKALSNARKKGVLELHTETAEYMFTSHPPQMDKYPNNLFLFLHAFTQIITMLVCNST
jgi:hypothetical protein